MFKNQQNTEQQFTECIDKTTNTPIMNDTSAGVQNIKQYFEFLTFDTILDAPTYPWIASTHEKMMRNDSAIPSVLGGGAYVHLGEVVSPVYYSIFSPTPWVLQVNPGDAPIIPASVTDNQQQ